MSDWHFSDHLSHKNPQQFRQTEWGRKSMEQVAIVRLKLPKQLGLLTVDKELLRFRSRSPWKTCSHTLSNEPVIDVWEKVSNTSLGPFANISGLSYGAWDELIGLCHDVLETITCLITDYEEVSFFRQIMNNSVISCDHVLTAVCTKYIDMKKVYLLLSS